MAKFITADDLCEMEACECGIADFEAIFNGNKAEINHANIQLAIELMNQADLLWFIKHAIGIKAYYGLIDERSDIRWQCAQQELPWSVEWPLLRQAFTRVLVGALL